MNSSCQDLFDRLPDDVVLSIFDKLQDAKSLCLSMSVCKRFHSIAPQVINIYLPVPHKKPGLADHETQKNSIKNLLLKTLLKPFHLISQMIKPKPKNEEQDLDFYSHYVPNQILKPFEQIRALHLKLPCQKPGSKLKPGKNSALLKWKADFGRELRSCVILGAQSWSECSPEQSDSKESRFLSEDELKVRIVWTISCLIAASARHYLVGEAVRALEKVENVEVSDESNQGRLCMNKDEILEMREMKGKGGDEVLEYRSRIPALRMNMWFLERVEAAGKVMEGATLVVIRPTGGGRGAGLSDSDMVAGAFGEEEGIDEAVRKLMVTKKCYTLEMNAF
ncbi:hypothetical protein CASFOL_003013 [Castilleja foliolosa]|uniref:F-box domain-containing protein n=1 Tax=Castilleja foliolosa TaxID=1961234 RepID=A0ABD3EHW0_9LAMI